MRTPITANLCQERPVPRTLTALSVSLLVVACAKTGEAPSANVTQAGSVSAVDMQPAAAAALVRAGMIAKGDRVVINGPDDNPRLLENIALEVMKVGGQPLITVGSNSLARRSFDDVPAAFDSASPRLGVAMVNVTDATINVDFPTSDTLLKGVPAERIAARARAGEPATKAFYAHPSRSVSLGNGLFPWPGTAAVFGKQDAEYADMFWKAVAVSPDSLRASGAKILTPLSTSKSVHVTSQNGTDLTFSVEGAKGFISDGVLTAEKVAKGAAAMATWLPAGEVLVPLTLGSATGKLVVDKTNVNGTIVQGLTLTFDKGKMTGATASSGLDAFKKSYDAGGAGKDALSAIDLGANPAISLPANTGSRVVWMAAGNVTFVLGDNRGWAGTNASDFVFVAPVTSPTMTVDGATVVKDGKLQ
jgi:aminopeptidase